MEAFETQALAVDPHRAAQLLGVSYAHFYRAVMPRLRTVKAGRRRIIPVEELRRYLREQAEPPAGGDVA